MINQFGELICEKNIHTIVSKIRKLSNIDIDNLWFRCGWINQEKEKKQKALPKNIIKDIINKKTSATHHVKNLLYETPYKEISYHLKTLE